MGHDASPEVPGELSEAVFCIRSRPGFQSYVAHLHRIFIPPHQPTNLSNQESPNRSHSHKRVKPPP